MSVEPTPLISRGETVDMGIESNYQLGGVRTAKSSQYNFYTSEVKQSHRYDRWGFPISEDVYQRNMREQVNSKESRARIRKENQRLQKWLKMMNNWSRVSARKVKRRCRKGIPDAVRASIWLKLSGAEDLKAAQPDAYNRYRHTTPHSRDEDAVDQDLGRIFPQHQFFQRRGTALGQNSLKNVLMAYANYDPEIGYCQGMGFIAILFLMYMPEADAFWLLVAVMSNEGKYRLRGSFSKDLALTKQRCFQVERLLERFLPRLHKHFLQENVSPFLYSSKWFMTIFTYNFPFAAVVRIWDVYLNEGTKIIFRVGLQCLKNDEEMFLNQTEDKIFIECGRIHTRVDADTLIERCMRLRLKKSHIRQAEEAYYESHQEQEE